MIIGIVMALRFPRGGIGLVIGGGLLVFSIHYVGLTAGESLADRGFVSPWLAMWAPNIILTIVGVIGLIRVSRESGSTRGGDFQEVRGRDPRTSSGACRAVGSRRAALIRHDRAAPHARPLRRSWSWLRIFILTALGFPIVSILINLTDTLNRLLDRGLTHEGDRDQLRVLDPGERLHRHAGGGALCDGVHGGGMGRHSELTAAKAGGLSFYRLMLPIFVASAAASVLAFGVGEMAPGRDVAPARDPEGQADPAHPRRGSISCIGAMPGWVYTIRSLDVSTRQLKQVLFERQGIGREYPDLIITADSAGYDDSLGTWRIWNGASRVIIGPDQQAMFAFRTHEAP